MNINGPARPVCRMVPADDDAADGHRNEKEKENAGSLIHEFNHLPGREGFAALTAPHQEIHFPGDSDVYGRKINDAPQIIEQHAIPVEQGRMYCPDDNADQSNADEDHHAGIVTLLRVMILGHNYFSYYCVNLTDSGCAISPGKGTGLFSDYFITKW
ncbi:hypothetical protein [Escherichia marmotae]|uniref:hypothetical protein n=1 Tax=Escherichia marmotae TaxID=1499973 RepID=UPI0021610DB1|nr:hypothetical protein [Escherichia marmotae]